MIVLLKCTGWSLGACLGSAVSVHGGLAGCSAQTKRLTLVSNAIFQHAKLSSNNELPLHSTAS